jgi:hypothetical protein
VKRSGAPSHPVTTIKVFVSLSKIKHSFNNIIDKGNRKIFLEEGFGPLVLLGFGVTTFTPAAYQRHRL